MSKLLPLRSANFENPPVARSATRIPSLVSTFNELSQRLTSITSAPNLATINDNDSGSSMSISEPSDNAYERDDSVVIGPTIENVEQCEEENV